MPLNPPLSPADPLPFSIVDFSEVDTRENALAILRWLSECVLKCPGECFDESCEFGVAGDVGPVVFLDCAGVEEASAAASSLAAP